MRRMAATATATAFVLALAGACGGGKSSSTSAPASTAAPSASAVVLAKNLAFSPKTVSVKVGGKVTWQFEDTQAHNVVGDGLKSPTMTTGSWLFTFDKAGTYHYVCTIHPFMKGTVEVS